MTSSTLLTSRAGRFQIQRGTLLSFGGNPLQHGSQEMDGLLFHLVEEM